MEVTPATNGTDQRLDIIIAQQAEIIRLLRPPDEQESSPSGTIELRETPDTDDVIKRKSFWDR